MGFGSAWLACGRRGEVMRVDTATGAVIARVRLSVSPWSIAAGEGAIWAVALQGSTVYRIDPATNRVAAQIQLGVGVPYLWAGGGAVWVADDGGSSLLRIDPGTNQVVASIPVGNGPAGFAFDGTSAWVLNHRENTLDRIDRATNTATRTAFALGAENVAAERIALFGGDLWVTGRGLDLVRVSRPSGAIIGRTEIGTGGIDVRTAGTSMWVASYEAAADTRGEPIAEALLRVDATGGIVRTVVPSRVMHVDGLAVADGTVWVFDGIAGLLVRLPG
jgi:YVTN family beta-propeller protein